MPSLSRLRLSLSITALSACTVLPAVGQTLKELNKLYSPDGQIYDRFGNSAIDDGVIVIGASGEETGSAYIFEVSTGNLLTQLTPSDAELGDAFGAAVAMSNGIIAVSATADDDNGTNSGSVYIFDAITGKQLFKLVSNDGSSNDRFGHSISIADGMIAIAAYQDDDNGSSSGSVYLFDLATGTQSLKITPTDGQSRDFFGFSLAMSDGVVAVGAYGDDDAASGAGSAYVFDAITGDQLHKLFPKTSTTDGSFGHSIAIDDGLVVVGSRYDDQLGDRSGAVYLFDAAVGSQLFKLVPNDGGPVDYFGFSVSIDNGIVAVGARNGDGNEVDSGTAYLFDASDGTQLFELIASDGRDNHDFGTSIFIKDSVVIVGAQDGTGDAEQTGAAYLFDFAPQVLQQPQSTVVDEGQVATMRIELEDSTGVTYQWRRDGIDLVGANTAEIEIIADPNDAGFYECMYSTTLISRLSSQAVLGVRPASACAADLTGDRILNFFDVAAFLEAYHEGCP